MVVATTGGVILIPASVPMEHQQVSFPTLLLATTRQQ